MGAGAASARDAALVARRAPVGRQELVGRLARGAPSVLAGKRVRAALRELLGKQVPGARPGLARGRRDARWVRDVQPARHRARV